MPIIIVTGAKSASARKLYSVKATVNRATSARKAYAKAKGGAKKRTWVFAVVALLIVVCAGGVLLVQGGGAASRFGGKPVFFDPPGEKNPDHVVAVVGKSFSKRQITALFAKAKQIEPGMQERQVFAALGKPTESSHSPDLQMTCHAWTMKGQERESAIMIPTQNERVLGIVVVEEGALTFAR
jgi:hypothetical protein